MKYFPLSLWILLLLFSRPVMSQYYETGQDPAGIKWLQIKTGHFTVIYPEKYGSEGIEFAKALDRSLSGMASLFPEKKFRIPVLVHSYSSESNGYVAWAPKRMELYPMPDQNSLPGDANTLLTTHELAHVFELESLNKGFTRGTGYIFGEQVRGLVSGLLPLWLLEGDAVYAETALSSTGRGRSPSFQKQFRAILLNERKYKYDKVLNGSYRDYVPDRYQSGYQMVTWAMINKKPDIWNKVFEFTGEQPFTIIPVNVSLNRQADLTKRKLYDQTFDSLKSMWSREAGNRQEYTSLNPGKKGQYINYYSPVFSGADSIVALKTSLNSNPQLVLINTATQKEKILRYPGYIYPMLISAAAGKIIWVESHPGVRWENRNFSVIMIYDMKKGTVRKISRRTRYPAAAISRDGKTICAVENTVDNRNNLVFIDPVTEEVIKTVPSPSGAYLQRPRWSADNNKITVISLTSEGEAILSYSVKKGDWQTLRPYTDQDIQSAFLENDSLYFVNSVSGTENIYLLASGSERQVTHSRFGATDPSISGNSLIFSDYTAEGNSICRTSASETSLKSALSKNDFLFDKTKIRNDITETVIDKEYNPVPYHKWQHLFRFHSWMPFYADIEQIQTDPLSVRPGVTIMSQNTLNTLTTTLGYEYNAEKRHVFHSKLSWKGWLPIFESWFDYGYAPAVYGNPATIDPGMTFNNTVSFPFRFSNGNFSQYIRPSLLSEYSRDVYKEPEGSFDREQLRLTGRFYASNFSRYALRDIYPKWGQSVDLNYAFSPADENILGSTRFIRTTFFFPGIFRNNGLRLRLENEEQHQTKNYFFRNRIHYPRGYDFMVISRKLTFASADYVFPVAYPDFNISSLLYVKRLRSGLFYDYASGLGIKHFSSMASTIARESFRSYGIELLADFHLLRIPFMISGGVQSAWKDISKAPNVSLIFNIDIYGFNLGGRQKSGL